MTPAKQKLNNLVQPAAAADLARLLGGQLAGTDAASITIESIAALHEAGPQDLSFCENMSFAAGLAASKAGLAVVPQGMQLDDDRPRIIIAGSPRAAIAKLLASTQKSKSPEPGIHPSAVVDRTADIAADAAIGPGAVVGANAQVHAGAIMRARSVLADNCILGERSVLLEGAVVGADGFGFVGQGKQRERFPHVGRAVIGPDAEIGANSCVDRGALGDTIVGARTKVDNLVQIGHNVRIGSDSIICGCVAIGGSTVIGSNCVIGGAAGINGHVELADGVQVMSMTLVMQSVSEKNQVIGGSLPAMPQKRLHKLWRRLLRITQGISK